MTSLKTFSSNTVVALGLGLQYVIVGEHNSIYNNEKLASQKVGVGGCGCSCKGSSYRRGERMLFQLRDYPSPHSYWKSPRHNELLSLTVCLPFGVLSCTNLTGCPHSLSFAGRGVHSGPYCDL